MADTAPASTEASPPWAADSADSSVERTPEFDEALAHLHRGSHAAILGGAGTGKSTLVRTFLAETDRTALVVAPTGLAALNVGGYTIHRAFSLRPETTLDYVRSNKYRPSKFGATLRQLDTLVIDEISMVRADTFDMIETSLRRFGPHPGEPFGGVQIVLVGDLYQLAPIVTKGERRVFDAEYETPFYFSSEAYDPDAFEVVQLTRVFRQQGDQRLIDILNSVRVGTLTGEDRDILNERVERDFTPPEGQRWLTLTTTKRVADRHNAAALDALPSPLVTMQATSWGDLQGFERPVPETLELKIGAQVMMVTNDADGRWVNGSVGEVVNVNQPTGFAALLGGPTSLSVEIDGRICVVERASWEVTTPKTVDDPETKSGKRIEHETVGEYAQFPLKLAWAVTIHKSQGQTLDNVVVDLEGGTFASGQLYVALSRCTSLEGMVLSQPVRSTDLKTDARITEYLAETGPVEAHGVAFLDALVVPGPAGEMPRILEIAAGFEDGPVISTLVNPQVDVSITCRENDIDPLDVPFAPLLPQAWEALTQEIADFAPAGVGIDDLLAVISAEMRRCGAEHRVPMGGVELPEVEAGIPGYRVMQMREAASETEWVDLPAPIHETEAVGYRLDARTEGTWPQNLTGYDKHEAAGHIADAAVRAGLTPYVRMRVADAEQHLGLTILGADTPADPLSKGGRVHFPGPIIEEGRYYSVATLTRMAREAGMSVIEQPGRAKKPVRIVHDRRVVPTVTGDNTLYPADSFLADVSAGTAPAGNARAA